MKYEKKHSRNIIYLKHGILQTEKQKNKLKYKVVLHKLVLNKVKVIRRGDGEYIYLYPFVHLVQKSFHGGFYMAHHLKSLLEHLTNILLTTHYG